MVKSPLETILTSNFSLVRTTRYAKNTWPRNLYAKAEANSQAFWKSEAGQKILDAEVERRFPTISEDPYRKPWDVMLDNLKDVAAVWRDSIAEVQMFSAAFEQALSEVAQARAATQSSEILNLVKTGGKNGRDASPETKTKIRTLMQW